jgi:hypothetical protein
VNEADPIVLVFNLSFRRSTDLIQSMGFHVKTFGAAAELKDGQADRAGVFFAPRGRLRCSEAECGF